MKALSGTNSFETERLIAFPLRYEQVVKYLESKDKLEEELQVNKIDWELTAPVKKMLREKILPGLKSADEDYFYKTIWVIIDKSENKIVGDIGIKGEPDENGSIEIGYGTHSPFQNKGYMTEAVKGMVQWAVKNKRINFVNAQTDCDNYASVKVLEKNNFEKFKVTKKNISWIYKTNRKIFP